VVRRCAKDMTNNLRIQATNAYLKANKLVVMDFKQHSATFLTVDQYTSVSDSLLIFKFLTSWGSCLLILEFHVSIQLSGFESMTEAYQDLCELWASLDYQEKSQRKESLEHVLEDTDGSSDQRSIGKLRPICHQIYTIIWY
jgi:hypothetical protein